MLSLYANFKGQMTKYGVYDLSEAERFCLHEILTAVKN